MEKGLISTLIFWGLISFTALCAWIYAMASKNELKRHEEEIFRMNYDESKNSTGTPDQDDTRAEPVHTPVESVQSRASG